MLHPRKRIGKCFYNKADFASKLRALNIYEKEGEKRINGKKYAIVAKTNISMIRI